MKIGIAKIRKKLWNLKCLWYEKNTIPTKINDKKETTVTPSRTKTFSNGTKITVKPANILKIFFNIQESFD
jgi:hypothetical protein